MKHLRDLPSSVLAVSLMACARPESAADPSIAPAPAPTDSPPPADVEARSEPDAPPDPSSPPSAPDEPDPLPRLESLPPSVSTSIGTPVEGRLEGGVPMPTRGPGFRFNPDKDPSHRFGTVEMVRGIVSAAESVSRSHPGSELIVGDLSRETGGDLPGHASHRSGRDVDVLFYLLDADGHPFPAKAIPLEPDGHGVDYGDLSDPGDDVPVRLDVPRTWAFFEALVSDPRATIGRIFLVEHLRTLLLDHARSIDAPPAAISRFADLTCQPGFPHDDHAHVRWFCSVDDIAAGCEDTRPIFPWHRAHLAEHGTRPVVAGPRTKPRPRLTGQDEAQQRAEQRSGPFDPAVTAFLERRTAWVKRPHPGRPYCR